MRSRCSGSRRAHTTQAGERAAEAVAPGSPAGGGQAREGKGAAASRAPPAQPRQATRKHVPIQPLTAQGRRGAGLGWLGWAGGTCGLCLS